MRLIKIAIACNILTIIICLSLDSIIVLKIEIVLFGLQGILKNKSELFSQLKRNGVI